MGAIGRGLGAGAVILALVAGVLGAPSVARAATVRHVPGDYPTIQAGIDAAADGDTVLVSAGTYTEHLTIGKDLTVESADGPGVTVIDGSTNGRVVQISADPGETPVVRGFTIQNGYDSSGPGAVGVNESASLENNLIIDNFGCFGAVAASGDATISGNTISGNQLACSGGSGSIYVGGAGTVDIVDNLIIDNGTSGIVLFAAGEPIVDGNVIAGNEGTGIELGNGTNGVIRNNLITGNSSFVGGGITALVTAGSNPLIVNNTFVDNTADSGSAIYINGFDTDAQVVNNVIVASSTGSALACPSEYDPAFATIAFNDVYNPAGPEYGGECTGLTGSAGNVSVDPLFVDPANGDYHLRADSPLIDAGTNADAPDHDFDAESRPHDGDEDSVATVDMGFDEATDPIAVVPIAIDFGEVGVSFAASPEVVTIKNLGPDPIGVTSAGIDGPDAGDFAVTNESCTSGPVPASGTCTITIGFEPGDLGARSADLEVTGPAPIGTRVVGLSGAGVPPASDVAWGSIVKAGPAYTWNAGGSLGRTLQSGTQRLHLVYSTNRVNGTWAKDSGPYVGVYYIRSTAGTTWSTPKRLNPSSQHAASAALAASGSRVYATWVSQTKWINYSPTAPRVLYVRVNSKHGAGDSWKSTVRLTPTGGRVDTPTIAASGTDAHIAFTNGDTGAIRVATSRDRGGTWQTTSIGSTTIETSSGRTGLPSVAVDGSTVAVVWIADNGGTVKARVSTDRGVSWSSTETVGSQSIGYASAAVLESRIAIAWTTADDLVFRQYVSGSWSSPGVLASLEPGEDEVPYAPQVILQGASGIGVAWTEQVSESRSELRWIESADGGQLWFAGQTLATSSSAARRLNDWGSVVWPSAETRYVVWNGWSLTSSDYRLYLRRGTGTPAGAALVAPAWSPTGDAGSTVVLHAER